MLSNPQGSAYMRTEVVRQPQKKRTRIEIGVTVRTKTDTAEATQDAWQLE